MNLDEHIISAGSGLLRLRWSPRFNVKSNLTWERKTARQHWFKVVFQLKNAQIHIICKKCNLWFFFKTVKSKTKFVIPNPLPSTTWIPLPSLYTF